MVVVVVVVPVRACERACVRVCVPACVRACVPACVPARVRVFACMPACACVRVCLSWMSDGWSTTRVVPDDWVTHSACNMTRTCLLTFTCNCDRQVNDQQTNFQTLMLNIDNPDVDQGEFER